MKTVCCTLLLLAGCGSVEEKGPTFARQLSTAFVAQGYAGVCSADAARVEDSTGAEIGNNCDPEFTEFPEPFGPPGVLGCVVADFGDGVDYGEVQVIAYSWDEERCGLDCAADVTRENARLDVVGADDVMGANYVSYGTFTVGQDGTTLNPAVSDALQYVFVCQKADPSGFVTAVDIDVIRVE